MRTKILITITGWLIGAFAFLHAQNPVTIYYDSEFPDTSVVEVYKYIAGKHELVGKLIKGDSDSLLFTPGEKEGLYLIGMENNVLRSEFIYNQNENLRINLKFEELQQGIVSLSNSKDNVAYYDLIKVHSAYDHVLDSIQFLRQSLDIFDPEFYTRAFTLDSVYRSYSIEKNGRLTYMQFNFHGTYSVKYILPLMLVPVVPDVQQHLYQTPYSFLNANYFGYVDPIPELMNHYLLEDKIIRYLTQFNENTEVGLKLGIDSTLNFFRTNTKVFTYIKDAMVRFFVNVQNLSLASYIMDKSGDGCLLDVNSEGETFLLNYHHVQLGSQVDDIILNDFEGNPSSLSNTCAKSDYTVLLFWVSWCKHCTEKLPQLAKELRKFKKVKVFAVSLDEDPIQWKQAIKETGLKNWVHVSELKPLLESKLATRFLVTYTPTIMLLNSKREIVAKNLDGNSLMLKLGSRQK